MGLDEDQVNVLKRCFDGFADEDGAIPAENVGNILSMMGLKVGSDSRRRKKSRKAEKISYSFHSSKPNKAQKTSYFE